MTLPNEIKSGRDFHKRHHWFSRIRKNPEFKRLSYDQHSRRQSTRALLNYFGSLAIVVFIFGALFVLLLFAWTSKDLPSPDKLLDRQLDQSTTIYASDATTILYQLHGDVNRRLIKLADLPEYIKWATLTAEDREFYNHSGFSIRGIIRSFISNTFTGTTAGGSTITQQFVKNAILTNQKTYTRKIKELILSYRIEQKFSKDEILQMYFNEIPYGSVVYGIEAASQTYFGKSAKDLTLAQAATLAAMTQRPTYFSPYGSNVDKLLERQQWILNEMVSLGHATQQEVDKAKAEKIEFRPRGESMIAPHFVMYIKELLAEKYGERYAEGAGMKIITTLDKKYQDAAEKAVADNIEKNRKSYNAGNAALVAIDTKTGEIKAMVGSADFNDEAIDGQVNVAIRPRQPGSSFKPFVYATAFSRGYTPDTVIYDVETVFKTDQADYIPHNYTGKEYGPVTMRKALAGSLNIPAVKTLYLAGINNVLDNAEKFGYTTLTDRSRFGLSLVLGGGEVSLLEHTAAFATLAQEGTYHQPQAILKIEDSNGKVLYEYKPEDNPGTVAMAPEPIRSVVSIMSDNAARAYIFTEKNWLTLPNRPVAAKTGTTNDFHDAWTLGFTPSLAAGVWTGNADNAAMKTGADGSAIAAPIWNEFMRTVLAGTPVEGFNPPPENTSTKPVLRGELAGVSPVKIDKLTGKLATEYTPADMIIEKTFAQFHCILYYVNKDDPQGPAPADPFADPQFATWEAGVQKWAQKQGYLQNLDNPPSDYDNLHTPENQPTLSIDSPKNGDTINSKQLNVSVTATAARGIARADYLLDGQIVATVASTPWNLNSEISSITSGIHTLMVKVYDDVGNNAYQSVDLNFVLNQ